MTYEPSHRKPPRQERWPNATPGEGWAAYQQGDGEPTRESAAAFAGSRNGYGTASNGYGTASNHYGVTSNGYGAASTGYADTWDHGTTGHGYGDTRGGHDVAGYNEQGQGYWAGGNGYGGTTTAYPAVGGGYADGFDGAADTYGGAADGYGEATDTYGGAVDTYRGGADGYGGAADTYGADADTYRGGADGYGGTAVYYETPNDWDGYAQPGHEFTGSDGYPAQDEYPALDPATSVLVAPDTMGEWWWQDRSQDGDREPGSRGPIVGAVTGFLAAAVAIGVATLAAAFVRPQASPVTAVGGVFIDRIPAALKASVMAHFGAHGKTVLLFVVVGLIAIVFGCLARRNTSVGVAGIAVFGMIGAFVAITRPESRASDVIPSAIGALAGIVALLWLAHASAPTQTVAPLRPAYGSGRRRAR
jgi:hypothetical protein